MPFVPDKETSVSLAILKAPDSALHYSGTNILSACFDTYCLSFFGHGRRFKAG